MNKYIVLLLLVSGIIECDVLSSSSRTRNSNGNLSDEVEQAYKEAREDQEHRERVAAVINKVITPERCEKHVQEIVEMNNQKMREIVGSVFNDIYSELTPEDKKQVGTIFKAAQEMFDALAKVSQFSSLSKAQEMALRMRGMALFGQLMPYAEACQKIAASENLKKCEKTAQEIARKTFNEWSTFCAEQHKRCQDQ